MALDTAPPLRFWMDFLQRQFVHHSVVQGSSFAEVVALL